MKNPNETPVIQIMWWARDARCVRGSAWQVLMALIMRCNPGNGFTCFPGLKLIAKDTGLHKDTVQTAINELVRLKFITRVVRANRSNYYTIEVETLKQLAAKTAAAEKAEKEAAVDLAIKTKRAEQGGPIEIRVAYNDLYESSTVDDLPLTRREKDLLGPVDRDEGGQPILERWKQIDE